jgi:eukaryotic-like serine/threonine-protein kinase
VSSSLLDQLQSTLGSTYSIERELGGGGMSRVFVADEPRLGRKVVVKVMSPDLAAGISNERFEREIKLAASLQQANIVTVLAAGDIRGLPYYTMPYVEGESLRARLSRTGALSISETIGILRDVARALAYAHERGVVHRDIKPDNVLLSGGTAVVTDFGIAKAIAESRAASAAADDSRTALTALGTSIGTPAYMAPEQAAADPSVDHRADLYSFGCMAYELLTGLPPFHGRSPQRLLAAHMAETPHHVSGLRPDAPQALAEMVMRCLEKEPSARPASAYEVAHALDSVTGSGMTATPSILLGGRRPLLKALAIYAVAFAAVAILARAAIVGVGLPEWVFPGALIVMALGLPVILFTGYVHYVTRKAVTRTPILTPGGSQVPQGTMSTLAMKASPHLSWRRTMTGGAFALGAFVLLIAGFMTMRSMGIGPFGSLLASGRLGDQERLIVTDFRSADSSLASVLSEAVRTTLGESRVVSIMPPASIASALQRMERSPATPLDVDLARELALREGVKAIVDGDVTIIAGGAGGYILSVRLVSADSGKDLASFRESASEPSQLLAAVDRISRKLRGRIGESLRSVNAAPPLERVTTASFPALQKYAEGARFVDVEGNPFRGAEVLREAIRLDSTFAMAYRKLGVALNNAGRPRIEVDSALQMAYRYRDRLSDRERLMTVATYYHLGPGRDRNKALEAYEGVLAIDPYERGALNNAANIYSARRQEARAESLYKHAIAAGLGSSQNYGNIIPVLFNQGKIEEARAAMAELQQRYPNVIGARTALASYHYAKGDFDSTIAIFREMAQGANPMGKVNGSAGLTQMAILQGRLAEMRTFSAETRRQLAALGQPSVPLADSLQYAMLDLFVLADTARALRMVESALATADLSALPFERRPWLAAANFFAIAGRPDRARALVARWEREIPDSTTRRMLESSRSAAQATVAMAEGRTADAIRDMWRSDTAYDGPNGACGMCVYQPIAFMWDRGGVPDSAIKYMEAFLNAPFLGREGNDAIARPYFHRRLGELYERKGDRTRAVRHYTAFVDLWRSADPELQPLVNDVRRRITHLGAG